MDHYNYEIAVCSLIFFSLTLVFYFSKRQFPSAQNKLFSIALVMGFFDIALDIASSIIIENVSRLPLALVYGVNTLFYSLQVIFPALMFLYALASVNPEKQGRRLRAMLLLPEAIMLALTLSNPFTHCVFYVKEGLYIRTALFPVLYILGAFYTLLTFITVIIYRKRMSSAYFWALYFFVFLSAASLGISFKYPEYLLSSIAIAIAMNIMYQVMQKPEDMLDRLTETFNRGAMQIYLKACIEGSRKYRLIMVEINGIRRTNNLFGYTMGDAVLKETAKFMQSISDDWTFRVISNQFLIVSTGEETGEYFIKKISERFSEPWDINNISMH
ncbi:MAG: diguanylate cyclase, partial [Eubacteriaceae bacterium]|nr:diguanylate cyclase [Eubacteriaceae bacterium]